jgi:alpha-L-fucosidase
VTVRAAALAGDKSVARGKTATADSSAAGNPAADAVDGTTTSEWCAADGATGHWWSVDLGSALDLVGTQITWETPGPYYSFVIDASLDGTTWTTVVDGRANTRISQTQVDQFSAQARYLRVTVTGVPSGSAACIEDFRAFASEAVLSSNALAVAAVAAKSTITP